ncbi:Acyl-coenzyme A thioesterase 8 [Smittium culicis]|uniref:Acyl-coenzyme A thioesterase 8 n=1 Tax=Smittium culicis TaxID=133412 RepID=A0A1R1YQG8_9FUNG|nr:Acyl-coenzyme A thioesterase 8 [Smittium culicis]
MEIIKAQIHKYFYLKEHEEKDVFFTNVIWIPKGARGVFGGQVVAQALAAAILTVSPEFIVHSLHSYFLLAGKQNEPIYYHVERIRDGRSFSSRTVLAKQKGRIIFSMSCSFQVIESSNIEHQFSIPQTESPEYSFDKTELSRVNQIFNSSLINSAQGSDSYDNLELATCMAIPKNKDIRKSTNLMEPSVISAKTRGKNPQGFKEDDIVLPYNIWWFKITNNLDELMPQLHQCLLAYITDHRLLSTVNHPHFYGKNYGKNKIDMMVSLDHAVWFHSDFRIDKWLIYELESPRFALNKGLVFGRVYDHRGIMVASVSQEGLIRSSPINPNEPPPKPMIFTSTPPQFSNSKLASKL